jgi:hypothetical protein
VLTNDPAFTRRDAVYYHLAESLYRTEKKAEALPYYERILREFEQSEYLLDALVVMVLLVPMIAIAGGTWQEIVWSAAIAVLVVARHSSNIRRLLRADERTAT